MFHNCNSDVEEPKAVKELKELMVTQTDVLAKLKEKDVFKFPVPDCMSDSLWLKVIRISKQTGDEKFIHEIYEKYLTHMPVGFNNQNLWDSLDSESKRKLVIMALMTKKRGESGLYELNIKDGSLTPNDPRSVSFALGFKYGGKNSNVYKFFFDYTSDDVNFDAGVNSMALICALLLTIPFQLVSSVDDTFLGNLKAATLNCSSVSFSTVYGNFQGVICVIITGSIIGLLLSTVYYLFKPANPMRVTNSHRVKERLLIMTLFLATVLSVVALLQLSFMLLNYMVILNDDICANNQSIIRVSTLSFSSPS